MIKIEWCRWIMETARSHGIIILIALLVVKCVAIVSLKISKK